MHLAESDVRVSGRVRVAFTSDSDEMREVSGAYSKVERGGWLQVYALPARAGSCSCSLVVSEIDSEAAQPGTLGVATGAQASDAPVKVFMGKDPDGNSIAFAQAPDNAALK